MENYERLIIDLLPNELTPKAKYNHLKHLIEIKRLHTAAKEKLEFDLNWFGLGMDRHKDAKRTYNVLMGIEEQPEETKPTKKEIDVDINYDFHEGRGEDNELL
jgi:hypothetical protein